MSSSSSVQALEAVLPTVDHVDGKINSKSEPYVTHFALLRSSSSSTQHTTTMTASDCQFSEWYPTFRSHTIRSVILHDLPDTFRAYLESESAHLPQGTKTSQGFLEGTHDPGDSDWSEDDALPTERFDLSELTVRIEDAIKTLGGSVLPKLNWSAPRDASWINGGTLKCQSAGDVYLLLQASDFCQHDLLQEQPLQLVLRKWSQLNPSREFRCFVQNDVLRGVSQREHTQHFAYLASLKEDLHELVEDFFETEIQGKFAGGKVASYVFDVYVDKQERVWLVDYNVWGSTTDSLLFEWDELHQEGDAEFRIVETPLEVHSNPLSSYRAPSDLVDFMAGEGAAYATPMEALMALCEKPGDQDDASD